MIFFIDVPRLNYQNVSIGQTGQETHKVSSAAARAEQYQPHEDLKCVAWVHFKATT